MQDEITKTEKVEEVKFPLNTKLLEETSKICMERKIIKERLEKIELSKGKVSDKVYERVKSDYLEQLKKNTDALLEKKNDIDKELETLYEAKKKVEENVGVHRERLEEMEFRHQLGEYEEAEFLKLADGVKGKIEKFEKVLAAIDSNIHEYEALFEGEEALFETARPMEVPPAPSSEELSAPLDVENEEYEIGEEGYFGEEDAHVFETTGEVKIPPRETTDVTQNEIQADTGWTAMLTIVEGEGKGSTFELKDDEITIGRASSNMIVLKEAKVSRHHAVIKRLGDGFLIQDMRSSNGVYVNNERVSECTLSDGDIIRIGDFVLKFSQP